MNLQNNTLMVNNQRFFLKKWAWGKNSDVIQIMKKNGVIPF